MGRLRCLILFMILPVLGTGCAGGADPGTEGPVTSTPMPSAIGSENGQSTVNPESHLPSVDAFFQWVNEVRRRYEPHPRACGHPNDSSQVKTQIGKPVFPMEFIWDEELANRAHREANRLSRGGQPQGAQFTDQGYAPVMAWGVGYFTDEWMLCAFEDVTMKVHSSSMMQMTRWDYFPLAPRNGMARVGLWFQDFFENGPVITRLGIGASATGTGTWWVLQFGP